MRAEATGLRAVERGDVRESLRPLRARWRTGSSRSTARYTRRSTAVLKNELIDATAVGDGARVVHFWSRLHIRAAHPAGAHDLDVLILAVVTLGDGEWRIQALEDVTLTDPRTGATVLRR